MKIKHTDISISLLILIVSLTLAGTINQSFNPQIKHETPKSSAGEITIVAPENETYVEPDNGYYPATYGFENDVVGNIPDEWTDASVSGSCSISVQDQKDDHKNVVLVSDADTGVGGGADATAQYNFKSPKTTGTIDFWVYKESGDCALVIQGNNDTTTGFFISIDTDNNGLFRYASAPSTHVEFAAGKYSDQQWFHMRIDFDCDTDTTDIYVDGIKEVEDGPFHLPVPDISFIQIRSGNSGRSGIIYFDAVGLSWDSNYVIGDNLNEGLLLSYVNSTSLNWQGYSLDGAANKTIMGNTTITMPSDGSHNIQVFGNNSIGAMYQSDMRYFAVNTVPYINIINPENKTYIEPDSGYYPATFGFESDKTGTVPDEWNDASVSGSCSISVQDHKDNHKNVVLVSDADTGVGGGADATAQYNFKSPKTTGTIDFWVYKESGDCALVIQGNNDTTTGFFISIDTDNNGLFRYASAPSTHVEFAAGKYSDQQWFHMRIDFDCDTDTTDIYVDGIKEVEDGPFHLPVPDISFIQIRSGNSGRSGIIYFDAVGLSWDSNYVIGDNLNEGLLLSYVNSTSLNWQGYSLDGAANKTILGNTTIPIPLDGPHNIQVFGNSSLGIMYNSSVRYFTTNAFAPTITINSPTTNELFDANTPDFDISISDMDLNATWYSLNGGITNYPFMGFTGTIDQSEWNLQSNGTVTIGFYANDSVNNMGYASVIVQKDVLGPIITVNSPQDDDVFGFYAPNYDLSIEEFNLDSIWYSIDYGTTVLPLSSLTGVLDQTEWETFGSGTVPIRFYANDSLGHESFTDVLVVKDLTIPIITIISPNGGEVFGHTPPDYNITITETELETYWYTLDGGTTNITISNLNGTIDQLEWDKLGNGTLTIKFYAKDEGDNIGFAEITVFKDINLPLITINSPGTLDIFGEDPPEFDLSIVEPNLDSMWYTLDGGITNTSFSGMIGTINSVEWAKFGDIVITIRFYARDVVGNIAFAEVQVEKDTTAPIVTVNEPSNAEEFENPPIFDISVVEDNLEEMWYTLDGGITNITIYSTDGIISQSAWNSAPDGALTIRFYARDSGGNEAHDDVHVVKYTPESLPPGIPGYNTIFLIGIVIIVSVLFSRKQLHK